MASIMVVDDDHLITEELGEQLSEMGYNMVGSASSGHEAIKQARILMPDLILMDIVMPEMDGIDAARTIREEMDIPSIFLTGYRDIEYLNRAMKQEPYGYLYKPPQREAIHAAIETALARRNFDRNLRASYESCQEILENTSEILLVVIDGIIISASPSTTVILGHAPRDIIGKPVTELIHPDDRAAVTRLMNDMPDPPIPADPILIKMSHRTDGIRWTSHVITPITWQGNRAFLCAATDITEYVDRENELVFYRRIIEEEQCGIFITDADLSIIYINRTLMDMLGYAYEELVGMNVSRLCMNEELMRENDFMETIFDAGRHPAVEMRHRKKDGSPIHVLTSGILLADNSGDPEYVVCTVIDITLLKEIEKQLSGMIETLEKQNEDIQSFTTIVSHDLRIPLIWIKHMNRRFREYLTTIEDAFSHVTHIIPERVRERLVHVIQRDMPESIDFIEKSLDRLERMTASIKRLSRYNQWSIEPELIDATEIVEMCLEHWRPLIVSGKAQVKFGQLPKVIADRGGLELIFSNLIDNAMKYLDEGRFGLVEISASRKEDCIEFHISDNGRGIHPDDMSRIFQVFQRGRDTEAPGDGMGLAFVRILVEKHGGEVWCTSTLGEGSVFTFTIPIPALDEVIH